MNIHKTMMMDRDEIITISKAHSETAILCVILQNSKIYTS